MQVKRLNKAHNGSRYQWLWSLILATALTGIVFLWQLLFGTQNVFGYLLTGTHFSLKWGVAAGLTYGLRIAGIAAWLWALDVFAHRQVMWARSLKIWFEVVALGVGLSFIGLAFNAQFWHQTWYNAVFLLTRNAMPMVSGLIVFTLVQPWLIKIAKDQRFSVILFGLMTLGIVFPTDPFKFGGGASFTGILMLGCLALASAQRPQWFTWRAGFALVVGVLSIVFMAWAQASRQMGMAQALRFVGSLSPLTVIPAIYLTQWVKRLAGSDHQLIGRLQHWVLLASLLATGSVFSHLINTSMAWFKANLHVGPLWLIAVAGFWTVLSGGITWGLNAWLQHLKLWTLLDRYWSITSWQALKLWATNPKALIRRIWSEYWRPLVVFVVLYAVQAISTLLMSESWRMTELITHKTDSIFSTVLLSYNFKILGGALLLGAAYWIIEGLTNRYWVSLLSVSGLALFFAVASRLKILSRATPILPSDMAELGSIKEIISLVNPIVVVGIVIALILVIAAIVWLEWHSRSVGQGVLTRGVKIVLGLSLLLGLGSLNRSYSFAANVLEAFGIYTQGNPNMLLFSQTNGPILTFVSQLDVKVMAEPKGYSKATIQKIVTKYQKQADHLNQTRTTEAKKLTVLFNLSESFAEPTRIPGVKLNQTPTPYINQLKKTTTSGLMLSAGYGGGTANMEYESLSGMSMGLLATGAVIPNNQIVPSENTAVNFGDQFSYASAIHPYTGTYYNRISVYKKYGFNKFAYLGSQYPIIDQKKLGTSPYLSDTTAYANALKQITSRKGGQLINLITMQNHMPYNADVYTDHDFKVSGRMSKSEKAEIEHYTQGLAYTDAAVKVFKKQLDRLNKPVIWVFYGDHLPGIYNVGTSVAKYSTDYFIYANKYAREHGANTQLTHSKYVGTNDFIAMAMQTGNAKVDAYSAMLTEIQQKLPTLWQCLDAADIGGKDQTGLHFVTQAGKVINSSDLTAKQATLLHDYQLIQYDLVAGNQYSLQAHMTTTVKKAK